VPFKSEAQRRKFGELVSQGKMSQETFNEWNAETPANLPDRLKEQKPRARPQSFDHLRQIKKEKGIK
jgi:hypothetical protein